MAYPVDVTFEQYCQIKKINVNAFRQNEPVKFAEWETLFAIVSPESFTQQKLFLINDIRRKYKQSLPITEQNI